MLRQQLSGKGFALLIALTLVVIGTFFLPTPVAITVRPGDPTHGIPVWACYIAMFFFDWPWIQVRAFLAVLVHAGFLSALIIVTLRSSLWV